MKLATLFSAGAVLQRGKTIPVWGESAPDCVIIGELGGNITFGATSSSGRFRLYFPPMDAGGPYTIKVTNRDTGEELEVGDIYIGEVWLASGQSNMEFPLKSTPRQHREFLDLLKIECPDLHVLTVPRRASGVEQDDFPGGWERLNVDNAGEFSAVALWFGRHIWQELGIPVGIIDSYWGGTFIEAWTSREALQYDEETRGLLAERDRCFADESSWAQLNHSNLNMLSEDAVLYAYSHMDTGNSGVESGWADPGYDDSAWKRVKLPCWWIDEKLGGNGAAWIRLNVSVPESWAGRDLVLDLGGIDKHDITYFNGVEVGRTGSGFDKLCWETLRSYRIPGNLVKSGINLIAVRCFSFAFGAGFGGKAEDYRLRLADSSEQLDIGGVEWRFNMEYDMGLILQDYYSKEYCGPNQHNTPTVLFEGMIKPLIPYGLRGVLWYQGETNARTVELASKYSRGMKRLIRDWRCRWGESDLPFIMVQLANYRECLGYDESSAWAVLRNEQDIAERETANLFMTTAIDIGEASDIHPQDKRSVGERLASVALREIYGCGELAAYGPRFRSVAINGSEVMVEFDHADGLYAAGEVLRGFYVAGSDRKFHPAHAEIVGNTVRLFAPDGVKPEAVRYAWADNPDGNLYNGAGLPAFPFRSDSWPYYNIILSTFKEGRWELWGY